MIQLLRLPVLLALSVLQADGPAAPPQGEAGGGRTEATSLHVSADHGDDQAGDGSFEKPYRTLSRALTELEGSVPPFPVVRLGRGEYGAAAGEAFPIDLPMGVTVSGLSSTLTTITGAGEDLLLRAHGIGTLGTRFTVVEGVALAGAARGVELAPSTGIQGVAPLVPLALNDVLCTGMEVGVDLPLLEDAEGVTNFPVTLLANGLRTQDCGVGLRAAGTSMAVLDLVGCEFTGGRIGVLLEASPEESPDRYEGIGVNHRFSARGCTFAGASEAGFTRRGGERLNRGTPYRFEDCTFRGNHTGLYMQRPAADSPYEVRDSRFLANTHFGLRAVGERGDPGQRSVVEGCEFRWNGGGLHVVNAQVTLELRRSRITNSTGTGVFFGNFMSDPITLVLENDLIADNGDIGLLCLADARLLEAEIVHCTITSNGQGGLRRKNRHSGESRFAIRNSIVADNGRMDLVEVGMDEVFHSLIGDATETGPPERGNLSGNPGFRQSALWDYDLRDDSPCVDRGAELQGVGELDLAGRPRQVGAPDLGAFERPAD